ncbi:MAG: hypothetical protein ACHQ6T_16205, partial [Myxococcota bacterium]
MSDEPADDFYVGYRPSAPPPVAKRVRAAVAAIFSIAAALALVLVTGQRRLDGRLFEFGNPRQFAGEIALDPEPSLVVTRPGLGSGVSRYLLVGPGKHGARELVAAYAGRQVTLRATAISRGPETELEVEPGSLAVVGPGGRAREVTALG